MKAKYKILSVLLVLAMLFTLVSCNDLIINGSKITKVTITLDFYGADGEVASSSDVKIHLYENNAPKTVAHIKNLINKGYYNGVCINNISPYFVEIGEYTYDGEDLVKKDYNYGTVVGEFDKNGFEGQREPINAGAIALKRDRGDGAVNHNSGTCGLYFMTMGTTDITESDYCFVGRVVSDDGTDGSSSSASVDNIDDLDRSEFSSFTIIKKLTDLGVKTVDEVSTTLYYNSKTGDYYKKVVNADETVVSKLNENGDMAQDADWTALSELEQEEFLKLFTMSGGSFEDEYYDYFRIPYQKIVVRQMKITK